MRSTAAIDFSNAGVVIALLIAAMILTVAVIATSITAYVLAFAVGALALWTANKRTHA